MNIPRTLRREVVFIRHDNPMPGVYRIAKAIAANEQAKMEVLADE